MKVEVYLTICGDRSVLRDGKILELEEESTLEQVLNKLKIKAVQNQFFSVVVNNRHVELSTKIKNGDKIYFPLKILGG